MADLICCLNVFREERLLPGCLESIRKALPTARIVAVDGPYASWVQAAKRQAATELENAHDVIAEQILGLTESKSTDGTHKILKSFGPQRFGSGCS